MQIISPQRLIQSLMGPFGTAGVGGYVVATQNTDGEEHLPLSYSHTGCFSWILQDRNPFGESDFGVLRLQLVL